MTERKIVGLRSSYNNIDGSRQRVLKLIADDNTETVLTAQTAAWLIPDIAKLVSDAFREAE